MKWRWTGSTLCSPDLLCVPVSTWSRAVLGVSKPTLFLAAGFMIYQNQTSQAGRVPHTNLCWVHLTCVTSQLWDTAIKHFALTDGAVSYLGKQRCCFLPGKLLQRQQRISVVGFCVILDIMNLWPKARCSVAGIASLFCRSVFSVCFCLCHSSGKK